MHKAEVGEVVRATADGIGNCKQQIAQVQIAPFGEVIELRNMSITVRYGALPLTPSGNPISGWEHGADG
jgi:hypothetical protein